MLEIYNINSDDIKGAIISSVVPQLVNIIKAAVEKTVGITPLMVGPGIKTGLNILMDQPRQVGTDMIVDAVATLNATVHQHNYRYGNSDNYKCCR